MFKKHTILFAFAALTVINVRTAIFFIAKQGV
jgi:hypothetical protein